MSGVPATVDSEKVFLGLEGANVSELPADQVGRAILGLHDEVLTFDLQHAGPGILQSTADRHFHKVLQSLVGCVHVAVRVRVNMMNVIVGCECV